MSQQTITVIHAAHGEAQIEYRRKQYNVQYDEHGVNGIEVEAIYNDEDEPVHQHWQASTIKALSVAIWYGDEHAQERAAIDLRDRDQEHGYRCSMADFTPADYAERMNF